MSAPARPILILSSLRRNPLHSINNNVALRIGVVESDGRFCPGLKLEDSKILEKIVRGSFPLVDDHFRSATTVDDADLDL